LSPVGHKISPLAEYALRIKFYQGAGRVSIGNE
jgi:hypothetical protein